MKYILMHILLITVNIFSQKIVWDESIRIEQDLKSSQFLTNVDNEDNIYLLLDGKGSQPILNDENKLARGSYLVKFGNKGTILSDYSFLTNHQFYPLAFYKEKNGYDLFGIGDTSLTQSTFKDFLFPIKTSVDLYGNITNKTYPYGTGKPDSILNHFTKIHSYEHYNTIKINNNVFIAYRDFTTPGIKNYYVNITGYDKEGNFLWRNGDTTSGTNLLLLKKLRVSLNNSILTVYSHYHDIKDRSSIRLLELDTLGNIMNKISYIDENESIEAIDAIGLENSKYIILGKYLGEKNNVYFLGLINNDGEMEKYSELPKNDETEFNDLSGMSISPSGDIVLYGYSFMINEDPDMQGKNIRYMYLSKVNNNFEFEWEHQWYKTISQASDMDTYTSTVREVEFLDENTIYAIGYKDIFDIFCSKISLTYSSVNDYESNSFFHIHPNPASDYIEISMSNKGLQPFENSSEIAIYDVLGDCVLKSNSVASQTTHRVVSTTGRIDISHLPRGVYFVRIGDNVEKFVKK